jgi:Cu-Zn family superoxide dismutase
MTTIRSGATLGLLALLGASAGVACGGDSKTGPETVIASSASVELTVYDDPFAPAMAGTPNPIPKMATGAATAWDMGNGKMRLRLDVSGLPQNRTFGAHLHKLSCGDPMKGGGHYENKPFPATTTANDPAYANPSNEVWLDFMSDINGKGSSLALVDWVPRQGEAKAIVIHAMGTANDGSAGAKLACLPLEF